VLVLSTDEARNTSNGEACLDVTTYLGTEEHCQQWALLGTLMPWFSIVVEGFRIGQVTGWTGLVL
jgi:hypothetical protein